MQKIFKTCKRKTWKASDLLYDAEVLDLLVNVVPVSPCHGTSDFCLMFVWRLGMLYTKTSLPESFFYIYIYILYA